MPKSPKKSVVSSGRSVSKLRSRSNSPAKKRSTNKKKTISDLLPENPYLVPTPEEQEHKPKPISTKVKKLEEPPVHRIYSRISAQKAQEERLSPYFGSAHTHERQYGMPESECLALDLDQLRRIAKEANKNLLKDEKNKIKGFMSPKETKESLCQKLIMKQITVLANGQVAFFTKQS